MALFQDSGQTPERRNEEATEIARRLKVALDLEPGRIENLKGWRRIFVTDMVSRLILFGSLKHVTPRQIFRLRETLEMM
jgi:hypothetical protein